MPRKEFEAFTRLDASDVNTYLMDQSVMSFTDSTARTSAITAPVEGMLTYLSNINRYDTYNGSSHVPMDGLTLIKSQTIGTAVTTVEVESVFSADYDAYRITLSGGVSSANVLLQLQFATAPATFTATNYYSGTNQVTYAGVATSPGQSNTTFINIGVASSSGLSTIFDVMSPFATAPTQFLGQTIFLATTGYLRSVGGYHNASTSFTGFRFFPASGTMTGGVISVYGYRRDL
jgi:hypothetical protein